MNEGLLFLAVSIILDLFANICLKKSLGFKNKAWGFSAVALIAVAFVFLSQAVKTMDLSVAYALWGAMGLLLTAGVDVAFFGVKLNRIGVVGILCMVAGIVMIKSVA